jgi:flagellar basal body-associated protein FliL
VSDEKSKNHDSIQDLSPALETEADEAALLHVEAVLAEEDPDFLNQVNKIKIDGSEVDLAAIEPSVEIEKKPYSTFLVFLSKPFEFKTNTKKVVFFWFLFISSAVAIKLAWSYKNYFLHQNLFLNSFAELGSDLKEYNPNTEIEAFYDNPQFPKNLVTISSMHVNVKPSENSGNNPMLAFEVMVEGLSTDAIVEIKDREAEFKDMLLRLTEEKTYDELSEAEGKKSLCEQFRDLLNSSLTRGQVRRVHLKSFIIKP